MGNGDKVFIPHFYATRMENEPTVACVRPTHLTKPDKPTARTPKVQPTAAPVSGKKPPPSRCALSRWSKPVLERFCAELLKKRFLGVISILETAEKAKSKKIYL